MKKVVNQGRKRLDFSKENIARIDRQNRYATWAALAEFVVLGPGLLVVLILIYYKVL